MSACARSERSSCQRSRQLTPSSLFPADASESLIFISEEFRSEDTEVRIHSMRRISAISALLGAERTKSELLPLLNGELHPVVPLGTAD